MKNIYEYCDINMTYMCTHNMTYVYNIKNISGYCDINMTYMCTCVHTI